MLLENLLKKYVAIFNNFKNRLVYAKESIKNRFPCKIYAVNHKDKGDRFDTEIQYAVLGRMNNLRTVLLKDLLDDYILLEKFSSKDAFILGFISCYDTICSLPEEERKAYFDKTLKKLMV